MTAAAGAGLRARLAGGQPLLAVFQKLSAYQATEVLAGCGLACIVVDTEHAVFSARELDACVLAGRAAGLPVAARLRDQRDATILAALDMGVDGIVVPHVINAQAACDVVAATRYLEHGGRRGFSNSPRAGRYGRLSMAEHMAAADGAAAVICQIEDREAVDDIDAIAAVPGVDCLLVGRADLAVSYRCAMDDAPVARALERIAQAAARHGVPTGIAVNAAAQVPGFLAMGFRFFIVGSDQSLLAQGADALSAAFANHAGSEART